MRELSRVRHHNCVPGRIGGGLLTEERRFRSALPYALFLVLVCVFLWRPLFTGAALLPGEYLSQMQPWSEVVEAVDTPPQWNPLAWDAIAQFYPWRVFYARWMSRGCIPLWNPHQFCGTPFLANGQSAVFYPLNLLFTFMNPITVLTVLAAIHLFLAAGFMYALLRRLGAQTFGAIIAGIVYAFSAFMILWLELPTFAAAAAWLPLALLLIRQAVERRSMLRSAVSGFVLAMPVLAGHLQIAFYVILAAMLWWLCELIGVIRSERRLHSAGRVCAQWAFCAVLLVLISAPQILSTLELAANSHRVRETTSEGYARFVDNAVDSYRLITAFQPDYYGTPAANNYFLGSAADYMEFGLYAGVLPLVLAVIGVCSLRANRVLAFFALLAVFALLAAFGTPLNAVLYYLVPGFSALGGPNRILVLYFLGIAGLAGFGADWVIRQAQAHSVDRRAKLAAFGALVLVAAAASLARVPARVFLDSISVGDRISGHESIAFPAFLVLSGAMLVAAIFGRGLRRTIGFAAVLLITVDLFVFGMGFNPVCERSYVYPRTPLTERLSAIHGARIAPVNPRWSLYETPDAILPPNAAMVYELYDVQGYDSLFTRAYKDISSEVQAVDSSPQENGNMVLVRQLVDDRLWRELQVSHVLAADDFDVPDSAHLVQIDEYDGVRLYEARDFQSAAHSSGVPVYATPNVAVASLEALPQYPGWRQVNEFTFVFEPFTFRLGLFLMLIGIGTLSCTAVCRYFSVREGR